VLNIVTAVAPFKFKSFLLPARLRQLLQFAHVTEGVLNAFLHSCVAVHVHIVACVTPQWLLNPVLGCTAAVAPVSKVAAVQMRHAVRAHPEWLPVCPTERGTLCEGFSNCNESASVELFSCSVVACLARSRLPIVTTMVQ
jgi:hypothetical protein